MLSYLERLHRLLPDVIKGELDGEQIVEVNSVQALLLYNIGSSELTAGELKTRGYYQGSNVSYNLKKLVETDYVHYERSQADKRSVRIKLTEKGIHIQEIVSRLFDKQVDEIVRRRLIDVAELNLRLMGGFYIYIVSR